MLLLKNSFIKIRKSLGRFFSLIFIVALGSAFFSGIRETSQDMIKTMDNYYDETALMDYKIVSTMGLTDDDVTSLKELTHAYKVVPSYSYETLVDGNPTKIYAINEEINKVKLIEGRMPTRDNEILVEEGTYQINDTITLEDSAKDTLKNTSYTVVGTIRSSLYIYENKGISTVGDGKLDTFMYIPEDNFTIDYYTEIYLLADDSIDKITYLDDYLEVTKLLEDELKDLKPIRETARYEEILKEAMQEIYDAEEELKIKVDENDQKFKDALNEIETNEQKLNDARVEYQNGVNTLNTTKQEMESTFADERAKIEEGRKKINSTLNQYGITESQIDSTITTLENQIMSLNQMLETLDPTSEEYLLLQEQITTLTTSKEGLNQLKTSIATLNQGEKELEQGIATWEEEYQKNQSTLNEAYQEIIAGEAELAKGKEEYNTNYQTYQEEIQKANDEIAKAKEEVQKLEKPVWYLLDREDNSGYTTFYESATKVDAIASVFPIFFILVALLMCMNTMTRMIDEERGEIGLFTSLGISKGKIIFSYIFYVLIATIVGLFAGLLVGYFIVPHFLFGVYTSSFTIPSLITYFNFEASIIIIVVCFLTMATVTYIAANRDFKYMPANLLRPVAPKMGRKVILERIPLIWNHLSFTWKVTIRNLFRYKKRIIMTIIGISGCTALLLTGFGIRDSVNSLLDKQFKEIQTYEALLFLDENKEEPTKEITELLNQNNITNEIYTNMESYTFKAQNKTLDVYVMAFEDTTNLSDYLHLKDLEGNQLTLDDYGVIITEKMAELLNVQKGDTFQIRNSDNELFVLKVSGVTRNYVGNYIYMNHNYYEKIFNNNTYNAIMINFGNDDIESTGNNLMNSSYFSSIQYTKDSMSIFEDIIDGMNDIVYLIIGFSTFLAITVLYNLTTINISERKREIASLKVLGFHDNEVSTYVYRETVILTIFGIILGIGLGLSLNLFVLTVAETDEILFVKDVHFLSYIYTFVIMIIFTLLVQFITYFILKKINMIDSLKSVE